MIRTEGLTHIHLLVRDLDRSVAFYKTAFGLEEQFRVEPNMVFLRTPGTRDTITLNQTKDAGVDYGRGGVDHFGFRRAVDQDLDEAVAIALAAGATLLERGEHGTDSPYAYLSDPDGYVIEL